MSTPGKPDQPISGGSSELENRLRAQWAVKAWSFLTLDDTARLGPTEVAYPDELNVRYVYDSWVPHHADVAVGDLAVIRGRTLVLGTGRIDAIHTSTGYKVRQRCPECRSTDYKYRKTANVPFRCSTCASEFWETDKKDIGKVTIYAADYSATYRDADDYFLVADLTDVYLNRSGQQSIRPLDPAGLGSVLGKHGLADVQWARPDQLPGGIGFSLSKTRLGQQRFREEMLGRFGAKCAFTGPQPPAVLEAAHIRSFSTSPRHERSNGLLLRRDLHALFDRALITVDPETWTIDVAPALREYPDIVGLQGRPLRVPDELRPRTEFIAEHANHARAGWL